MKTARLYKIVDNKPERIGRFVGLAIESKGWSPFTAIGLEKNGILIAGVVYDNYNGKNIFAHIAATGRHWLNKEFLWYMHHYPFMELKVSRVTGMVSEKNKDAIKFIEHLGGELESKLEKAHPDGDLLIYRMFKKDCKYLRK